MLHFLPNQNFNFHTLQVLNESEKAFSETKFGITSLGPVLGYQCIWIPVDFIGYFNLSAVNDCNFNYV